MPFLVSTSRVVRQLAAAKGWIAELEKAGVEIPVDVCTYYSPRVRGLKGRVMTNAAKWAYYAPGMLGVEVAFGSLKECVESAIRGRSLARPAILDADDDPRPRAGIRRGRRARCWRSTSR